MPRPFRFAVYLDGTPSREAWQHFARRAEDLGYSTLLMPDRAIIGLAPIAALTLAAAATTRLRVGSGVFCNDFRHPALLAKEMATLDLLSDGRVDVGLGAGIGPFDYQQLGIPFADPKTRLERLEESVRIFKQFFAEDRVTFAGKHYAFTNLLAEPKPVQRPHPPFMIGGSNRRLLALAGREANIVSVMFRVPAEGIAAPNPLLEQQIACIRESAGDRFEYVELSQMGYVITIPSRHVPSAAEKQGPPIPRVEMSIEQTIDHLLEMRSRYGFSYITVMNSAQMESWAPVVARLAGR